MVSLVNKSIKNTQLKLSQDIFLLTCGFNKLKTLLLHPITSWAYYLLWSFSIKNATNLFCSKILQRRHLSWPSDKHHENQCYCPSFILLFLRIISTFSGVLKGTKHHFSFLKFLSDKIHFGHFHHSQMDLLKMSSIFQHKKLNFII